MARKVTCFIFCCRSKRTAQLEQICSWNHAKRTAQCKGSRCLKTSLHFLCTQNLAPKLCDPLTWFDLAAKLSKKQRWSIEFWRGFFRCPTWQGIVLGFAGFQSPSIPSGCSSMVCWGAGFAQLKGLSVYTVLFPTVLGITSSDIERNLE